MTADWYADQQRAHNLESFRHQQPDPVRKHRPAPPTFEQLRIAEAVYAKQKPTERKAA